MQLTELNEYLRVNSLQYFVGDDIEVTEEVLDGLVKKGLGVYGNYRPIPVETQDTISAYSHVLSEIDGRKISNITDLYIVQPILGGEDAKVPFNWEFSREAKTLRSAVGGTYYIQALVFPLLNDMEFHQTEFLDLMQGLYMMYVGEARKAFVLQELPFENDAPDIYAAGETLYNETLEELAASQGNWWESVK